MLPNGATNRRDRNNLAPVQGNGARENFLPSKHPQVNNSGSDSEEQTIPPEKRLEPDIRRLLAAGRQAEVKFNDRRRYRRTQLAGWTGLCLLTLAPAILVATMPDRVVAALPSAAVLYQTVGHSINVYGVEIRSVEVQNLLLDGQRVMSVKGEIVNVTSIDRKIPWLRFGLHREEGHEVYHWQLNSEARPLRPGETRTFTTRIAAPPETASRIEIRFAHASEIGSNAQP